MLLLDGPAYHFHLTIALGGNSSSVYQSIATELARREVVLRAIARHLVLFYYDDDQGSSVAWNRTTRPFPFG